MSSSSSEEWWNQLGKVRTRGVAEKGTWIGTEIWSSSALNARGVALVALLAKRAAEMTRRDAELIFIVICVACV